MREENRFRIVTEALDAYDKRMPFFLHLKLFFRRHRQMGSRDRKLVRAICFNYFRLGASLEKEPLEVRVAVGTFLCEQQPNSYITYWLEKLKIKGLTVDKLALPTEEKIHLITEAFAGFTLQNIFPFPGNLSEGVNRQQFYLSLLRQPNLWLRVRKGKMERVMKWVKKLDVAYELPEGRPLTIGLPNGTKIDEIPGELRNMVEVQDLGSQMACQYFKADSEGTYWDCCSGSGGKSLALADVAPRAKLFVSDARERILYNLQERFRWAGIRRYAVACIDLTEPIEELLEELRFTEYPYETPVSIIPGQMDGIILDAPCSGSGTWGRTPEQLYYFNTLDLETFQKRQLAIATHALPFLKPGGELIYITCSAFKAENELVVKQLCEQHQLELKNAELIEGYRLKADTFFVAQLTKPL